MTVRRMSDHELHEIKRKLPGSHMAERAEFELACRAFGRAVDGTAPGRIVRSLAEGLLAAIARRLP